MTGTLSSGGGALKMDRRLISLSDFLYLAIVCFVSPKEPEELNRREKLKSGSPGPRASWNGGGGGNGRGRADEASGNAAAATPGLSTVTSGDRRFFSVSPGGSGEETGERPADGPLDDSETPTSSVAPRGVVRQDNAFDASGGDDRARASYGGESFGGGVSPSGVGAGTASKRGYGHGGVSGARRDAASEERGRDLWLSEGNAVRGDSGDAGMDVFPSTTVGSLSQRRPKVEPETRVQLSPITAPAFQHAAAAEKSQKTIAEGDRRRITRCSPERKGDPSPSGSFSAPDSSVTAQVCGSRGEGRRVGDEATCSTRVAPAVGSPPSPACPDDESLRDSGTPSPSRVVEVLEEVARRVHRGATRSRSPSDHLEDLRWGVCGRHHGVEDNEKEEDEEEDRNDDDEKRRWQSGRLGLNTQDAWSVFSPTSNTASAARGSRGVRGEQAGGGVEKAGNLSSARDDGRSGGGALRAPSKPNAELGRVSCKLKDWRCAGEEDRSDSASYASAEDGAGDEDGPSGTGATVGDDGTVAVGGIRGQQRTGVCA